MLPLLREDQDSEKGKTSTVEERVIGAGLKALDKHEDGAAAKELFHMFAVTMEDFVHPIAVIELLWRSCCVSGSGSEKEEEGSLATRLKVRQWTQMLLDHSLLLGSSSEGVHLHDIVLQYLRKRLSAEEIRVEQQKVSELLLLAAEDPSRVRCRLIRRFRVLIALSGDRGDDSGVTDAHGGHWPGA